MGRSNQIENRLFRPKNWVRKTFGYEKNKWVRIYKCGYENVWIRKKIGYEKNGNQKIIGYEKIWVRKIWVVKKWERKKFGYEKNWVRKILG